MGPGVKKHNRQLESHLQLLAMWARPLFPLSVSYLMSLYRAQKWDNKCKSMLCFFINLSSIQDAQGPKYNFPTP